MSANQERLLEHSCLLHRISRRLLNCCTEQLAQVDLGFSCYRRSHRAKLQCDCHDPLLISDRPPAPTLHRLDGFDPPLKPSAQLGRPAGLRRLGTQRTTFLEQQITARTDAAIDGLCFASGEVVRMAGIGTEN
jgi:hypothetical protein